MAERIYAESDWAVRRWDRFNDQLVKPLSFCHFWRTVLLYVTIQQLLLPWRMIERSGRRLKSFAPLGLALVVILLVGGGGTFSGVGLVISFGFGIVLGTTLGLLMAFEPKLSDDIVFRLGAAHLSFWRGVGHSLWLLAWPLRTFFPPVGRRLVAGVVTIGEPVEEYSKRHKEGLEAIGMWALVVACVAVVGFVVIVLLLSNWLMTVAVIGAMAVVFLLALLGILQAAWKGFAAVMGLLWGAAVAAKHGVCPPVTIIWHDD